MAQTEGTRQARPIAWAEGRVLPASEATVPLLDDGFLRGDAVFEAILVRRGRTHALEGHLARMRRSAKALGIRLPSLRQVVTDLLAAWGERDGAVRLIVTRGGTVRGLVYQSTWPKSFALQPMELPWRTALSGVKTLSYAVNTYATREAQRQHADDALITSGGTVLEVPTAAIAWVRADRIHSPDPRQLPILDSITLAQLRGVIDVRLGVHPLDDLLAAQEVFVLSATRPVVAVHAVGDAEFPAPGPVTEATREAFQAHIDANLDPLP
ncbi:MAG: aminotransferase class IV [Actinobacteria bacterium]|nr:aminotransferase class IV [Actinomycetota bacterium]